MSVTEITRQCLRAAEPKSSMLRRISFRLFYLQVNIRLSRTYSKLYLDMNEEMLTEVQEMVIGLMEKLSPEKASKEAQQQLQKKYGNGWNVIIGKGYGAAVTAVKVRNFLDLRETPK